MHLLPPAGSCTQEHRTVSFRGAAAASFHARNVSKILFSVCLEREGLTLLSCSNHPAEGAQDAPASRHLRSNQIDGHKST